LRIFRIARPEEKTPASSPATAGGRNEVDMDSIRTILKSRKFETEAPDWMRFAIRKAAREMERVDLIAQSCDAAPGGEHGSAKNNKKNKVVG
jgi:hypothetical protein